MDISNSFLVYYFKRETLKRSETMKKKLMLAIFILIVSFITIRTSDINSMAKQVEEEQPDILYQDVIITALAPSIINAISTYYSNILSEIPLYDSTSIKVLEIERPNGSRTWTFIIKLEVKPFIGPHITVGKDIITIGLSYPGTQIIKNFEHVEDFPLPERYQDLYLR
jgi:hypothetical protein